MQEPIDPTTHAGDCLAAACTPQEPEPMGTAGPLALARDVLHNDEGVPFFVLNRCVADEPGREGAEWGLLGQGWGKSVVTVPGKEKSLSSSSSAVTWCASTRCGR